MLDKKIIAGGVVLFGAAFWFYIKPHYLASSPPPALTEEQIAEAPRPTLFLGKASGEKATDDPGIIFNLKAPPTSPSYVKVVMALEFDDPKHKYIGVAGHAIAAKNAVFAEEIKPEMHKILDALTSIFGAKSIDEVSTTAGREKLKAEIVKGVNAQLHSETVTTVYFSVFITQ